MQKQPESEDESNQETTQQTNKFVGNILIEDLRSEHLGKTVSIIGILKSYSKVLIKVIKAKFECPSCGTIISVVQKEDVIAEPTRCSCGRKSAFKEIERESMDFQMLEVSDDPEKIDDLRSLRQIKVFLGGKLTIQAIEKTLKLNQKIHVIGEVMTNSGKATVSGLSIEGIHFNLHMEESDKELINYLMAVYIIPRDQAEFLTILKKQNHSITKAVMKAGICRDTHYRWLKESNEYERSYEFIKESKKDFVESEMMSLMRHSSDKVKADLLKFTARAKYDYVEKKAVQHDGKLEITELIPGKIIIASPYDDQEDEEQMPDNEEEDQDVAAEEIETQAEAPLEQADPIKPRMVTDA